VNLDAVRRIADAVLYEGYILYPYRASAQKNRSRWQWGVVMGPGYAAADPSERDFTQAEWCSSTPASRPFDHPSVPAGAAAQHRGGRARPGQTWDEAVEREIEFTVGPGDAARLGRAVHEFAVDGGEEREPLAGGGRGPPPGTPGRPGVGAGQPAAGPVAGGTAAGAGGEPDRGRARPGAPGRRAAHRAGRRARDHDGHRRGVHLDDRPAEWAKTAVAACENIGGWPVLADPDGGREVMLSSPIILYDHPEVAPESPGELYDGTEIDEILTLRTLALSDDEKLQARATDPRAAALIDRVEAMDARHRQAARHGPLAAPGASGAHPGAPAREAMIAAPTPRVSRVGGDYDPDVPWWDPGADASVSPDTDTVNIGGHQIARGSLVRLRPGNRRSDAQDMFLIGRIAEVQAVLLDVDDHPYLAVALADDPTRICASRTGASSTSASTRSSRARRTS
jgi:hypothetical protein